MAVIDYYSEQTDKILKKKIICLEYK